MDETRDSAPQLVYARVLRRTSLAALALVVAAFALYVTGALPSCVTAEQTIASWHLPADEYAEAVGAEPDAGWLERITYADRLSILTLTLLALVPVVCLARVVPVFLRRRDYIYALIAAIQITVLILAAFGPFG